MGSKVSVIIPVYNVEKYIKECIDSVILQTYKNIEIIIVNDGSTDKSGFICDSYSKNDTRIKVIHKKNEGLSSARNVGLDNATGEYICFLDSDDWMDIQTINEAINISIKYEADIVFWSCIKEYLDKSLKYKVIQTFSDIVVFESSKLDYLKRRTVGLLNEELNQPTKTDSFISAWGKLYKSSLIKKNGIRFLSTKDVGSEDVPFNVQSFYYSKKIIFIDRYFNHYRMTNENSLTKNHKNTLFPRFKNLYFYLNDFLNKNNLSNEYFVALNNRFVLSFLNNCLSISSPNYKVSIWVKLFDIRNILNDRDFELSINNFNISYLPRIWRIFFWFGKRKYYFMCLLMALTYQKIKFK